MSIPPGTRLGTYEIISLLGTGGMGEVYRARDLKLERDVAIKILPERFASDSIRLRRFEQEARAASGLNHPNIITIYDIGREGSTHYIAMEYIAGRTLRDLLSLESLSLPKLLDLAAQMTEALAKAHAAGIVHRDLKPENVMITEDGYVKILDFGLAKPVADPSDLRSALATHSMTGPGTVMGTAGYMSPEQARGEPADFRSDQFSLGTILYEMATGRRAFRKDSAVQTLSAIIEEQPDPVSSVNPSVPDPLGWILDRCLAKNPEERYASTLDLAREVRVLRDRHSGISAGLTLRKHRKPAAIFTLVGAGALLLVALAAVIMLGTRTPSLWKPDESPGTGPQYLAVSAFKNLAGDPEGDHFSAGLTEAITTRLADLEGFHVVPASTEIGAQLVLEGGVQRAGDTIRITYRVIRSKEQTSLGGGVVDGSLSEIFALQDRVAGDVARQLERDLAGASRAEARSTRRRPTEDVTAYSFYLQGRGYLRQHERRENTDFAIALFNRALERDPTFAMAQAGLGEAYWRKYENTQEAKWVDLALEACREALEVDGELAEAHVSLATVYSGTGRHTEAAEAFNRAIQLDPKSDDAYRGLATVYSAEGQLEQAEKTYQRAIELRPDYWGGYSWLGTFYFRHGRYEEAARQFERVIELTPDNYRAHSSLGGLYHLMGRFDKAEPILKRSVALKPTSTGYTNLGTFYFFQRRYEDAVPMMEKAVELAPNEYMLWGNLADAYRAVRSQAEKAPGTYRRAIELATEKLKVNPKAARVRGSLAVYYARVNEERASMDEISRALQLSPSDVNILFDALLVYELAGERDLAVDALEKAVKGGYSIEEIRREPDLESLRKDPRFQRIVR